MNFKRLSIYLLALLLLMSSCNSKENNPEPILDARLYCPLQQGSYIIYEVTDTILDFGNVTRPSNYQLKIRINEKLENPNSIENYTVETFKRNRENEDWISDSMWVITYNKEREIISQEVGVPFVKLVTPLKAGISWNGNKYNSNASEIYKTRSFERPYFVADTIFQNTVRIIQNEDFDNRIAYTNKFEVYAKDLGLVYRLHRSYRYNQNGTEIEPNVRIGFIREMKYLSHGKE